MKDNPLVSIVITLYNSEKYIRESIMSVQTQTYQNIEIIVVNDGSKDNSSIIVKKMMLEDQRIKFFENTKNMGIPYTRNEGIKYSNGKYMAVLDSDDLSEPTRIEKQVYFLENNPNSVAVGSFYKIIGEETKKKRTFVNKDDLKISLLFACPFVNSTMMIRKEIFDKRNIKYNEKYYVAQDYELWSNLTRLGELNVLPQKLVSYRWGHENISKKTLSKQAIERGKLIANIKKNLLEYYNFTLTNTQIEIFTTFFMEPNFSSILDEKFIDLYFELVKQNDKNSIFDRRRFSKVSLHYIATQIASRNVTAKSKLTFYLKVIKGASCLDIIKGIGYIVLKEIRKR